ncbi:MAG: flagellar biosynthesis protein FlhB [Sphingomonas sp. 28-62-20]|uniref:EscU/YscU/HrcU family type III secretion system export apparatus switch protein n=1 Tax=Sphingomonas sp. 28-62-20 TaxID=1970433 RepID=UPI000BD79FAA|nr:MAG: flagellar biosynthesis protein FlhB [Sphingomonas sp. 28-62-20]
MADEFGEKTEGPTPKRKQKAFDDGQVLRSREFATALVVLAGCGWLALFGPALMAACKGLMIASFSFGSGDIDDFQPMRSLAIAGWQIAPPMIAMFAIAVLAAIFSQVGLGALTFNGKLMAPKASRINPASGLKRIFGPQGWVELGKSLLKVILLGSIGYYMLIHVATQSIGLATSDLQNSVASLGSMLIGTLFAMAAGLVVIAGIDVPIQIIQLLRKLRMSKQEIKDEHKESEGNPENKQAQRQRRHDLAKRNMRKAVSEAHVILTNPTHFAVALRYDRGRDQVPVVVAKGRGVTAQAIRELAQESRITTLEYPMLARAIYYTSREGQEVRDDLYLAIATVLAFVFGLNAKAGGTPPPITVPETARFDENGVKITGSP